MPLKEQQLEEKRRKALSNLIDKMEAPRFRTILDLRHDYEEDNRLAVHITIEGDVFIPLRKGETPEAFQGESDKILSRIVPWYTPSLN